LLFSALFGIWILESVIILFLHYTFILTMTEPTVYFALALTMTRAALHFNLLLSPCERSKIFEIRLYENHIQIVRLER
jgi:hypothetical protein